MILIKVILYSKFIKIWQQVNLAFLHRITKIAKFTCRFYTYTDKCNKILLIGACRAAGSGVALKLPYFLQQKIINFI